MKQYDFLTLRTNDDRKRLTTSGNHSDENRKGTSVAAPALQLKSVVQRDEKDEEEAKRPQGFSTGEGALGFTDPNLKLQSPSWLFNANKESAHFGYQKPNFGLNLGYQYGGATNLGSEYRGPFIGANGGGASGRLGYDPSGNNLWAGGSYGKFSADASVNLGAGGGFGLNLGYGARLSPTPQMLGNDLQQGWNGLSSLPGITNPNLYQYYKDNQQQFDAMSTAAD